jgi:hypothetical protein
MQDRQSADGHPASRAPSLSNGVAAQLYLARQFDQVEQGRKTVEMDPNFAVAYSVIGQAYAGKEMYSEALQAFEIPSAKPGFRDVRRPLRVRAWNVAGTNKSP